MSGSGRPTVRRCALRFVEAGATRHRAGWIERLARLLVRWGR